MCFKASWTQVASFWTPVLSQYIWPVFGLVGNAGLSHGSEVPSSTEAPERVCLTRPQSSYLYLFLIWTDPPTPSSALR